MKTRIYEDLSQLFPLWRETTLQKKGSEKTETNFILDVFKQAPKKIKSVIDLGGGVGTHSSLLAKKGYDVTLFDQSRKALRLAKKTNSKIKTVQGSFETIDLHRNFDAAICMWSTLSYIFTEKGRKNFYDWQKKHIKHLIILDEANFYRYGRNFHKVYKGSNKQYKMTVERDWVMVNNLKKTKFVYRIYDKRKNSTSVVRDAENEQYVPVDNLKKYLGKEWKLKYFNGDYSLKSKYIKSNSSRIITTFFRKGV